MAPLIIFNETVQGEVFFPGQIFLFGGFALQANSIGHLEQIDSYVHGHQISFGKFSKFWPVGIYSLTLSV